MALENDDLIVVQKNGGGELRKAKISDIKPDIPDALWVEDSGKLYPKTLTNNVGIGASNPSQKLTVRDDGSQIRISKTGANTEQYLDFYADGGYSFLTARNNNDAGGFVYRGRSSSGYIEYMRIQNNGDVGIGTDSPLNTLHVQSSTNTPARFASDTRYCSLLFSEVDVNKGAFFGTDNGDFRFVTGGDRNATGATTKVRIKEGGNVGIGTDNPQADLVVANKTDTTFNGLEFSIDNSQGGNRLLSYDRTLNERTVFNLDAKSFNYKQEGNLTRFRIDETGNVGIGTASPQGKLDVNNGANRSIKFEVDGTSGSNHIKSYQGSSENDFYFF